MSSNVIAIDGPAASGKSTVASLVAKKVGAVHVGTGDMYRAVALAALRERLLPGRPTDDDVAGLLRETELTCELASDGSLRLFLDKAPVGHEIRSPEVSTLVSQIASMPPVRRWLVAKQRALAGGGKMLVMEGRDIGTVVFPDALCKFFLTASPTIRAERRLKQSGETFDGATVQSVAKDIEARDLMDSTRADSPLRRADDAELVDNSGLTIEQTVELIARQAEKKIDLRG